MDKILQKRPEEICKDVLKIVDNEKVNVELDENSKSSLYVFLTNTIYISNKVKKGKSIDEQNKSKVLVIAHECAHSIQAKSIQMLNFVLSNLEIILFVAALAINFFLKKYSILVNSYITINILSILVRWYLEMNATINSVNITAKYMLKNGVDKEEVKKLILFYKKELLKTIALFILFLFGFKILRLMIILII